MLKACIMGFFRPIMDFLHFTFYGDDHRAEFRKFATLPTYQSKGCGSQLFEYSFQYLQQQKVKTVYCSARLEKQGFYKKKGNASKRRKLLKKRIELYSNGTPFCLKKKWFEAIFLNYFYFIAFN